MESSEIQTASVESDLSPPTPGPLRDLQPERKPTQGKATPHLLVSAEPTPAMDHVKWKEAPTLSDRIMAYSTIVIALGTLVSAGAIVMQWREMVAGGKQTDAIIAAAKVNAKAAEQNAEAAHDFANSAQSINTRIGIAEKDVAKMASGSLGALRIARDNMKQDERAWVGLVKTNGNPELDKPLMVETIISNTGKTPATNLILGYAWKILKKTDRFEPTFGALSDYEKEKLISTTTLLPNQFLAGTAAVADGKPVDKANLEKIYAGELMVYVYGRVCYRDVFDFPHWEHFCRVFAPSHNTFANCAEYNEIDSQKTRYVEKCEIPDAKLASFGPRSRQ